MVSLKGVAVGGGYFSHFHYDAWSRIDNVTITAVCDLDEEKTKTISEQYDIPTTYTDFATMLEIEKPDFVDIITPPPTHFDLCRIASEHKVNVICQKPLAPTLNEAKQLVSICKDGGIRLAVHENWRFQPWYREIKSLIQNNTIGDVHSVYFRSRMGDGWGDDAYLSRQPYFRDYPRLLIYENGVHFIDTFRYLFGEVDQVYCKMKQLNPVIKGEDRCLIHFTMKNGMDGIWDANRFNEPNFENPRYTFGECLIEGKEGSIRLYADGKLTIQRLGENETVHDYQREQKGFAGDCVYAFQNHVVNCLLDNTPFETNGDEYLKTLAVQEAAYQSAQSGVPEKVI